MDHGWSIVEEKAIRDDNSLFFPEKLSREFLDQARKTMGSYLFANQYLNEVIPSDLQTFKRDWFKTYQHIPKNVNTFIYVDPAISQADSADFTGVVVVHVDSNKDWYVPYATRFKITPTEIISLIFRLVDQWNPQIVGIEEVAYQKALLYFLDEEMRRRNVIIPIKGIRPPNEKSKQQRILSLVPRFEWGHVHLAQGLTDLELELLKFPRGAHDDLIDALASIDYIAFPPSPEPEFKNKPSANDPRYESWYIKNLINKTTNQYEGD